MDQTSPNEIVNIAPGEGQIPVSFTSEPNWGALAFPKDYSTGRNHFNEEREIPITPSKYVHTRLKCCDDRFASNPQYIFHALDWIERNAAASSVNFPERKQFQSEINVGQLVNHDNVRKMISDDQIFSSVKNRGTCQYFQMCCWMSLLKAASLEFTCSSWVVLLLNSIGLKEILTDEQVNAMDWSTKVNYLKSNPVTVAR